MGQQAHGGPQFSPDGRWWWNGQQWVPVQQPPGPQYGSPQPGKGPKRWPWVVGGIGALALLMGICTAAISSTAPQTERPAQPAAGTSRAPTQAAAPAQPRTLLDLSGSGIKNSPEFGAPNHWRLHYSYDCSAFGGEGNFQVYVTAGSNGLPDPVVNELGASGESTTDVYDGGTVHLEMNSECRWHVTATTS